MLKQIDKTICKTIQAKKLCLQDRKMFFLITEQKNTCFVCED